MSITALDLEIRVQALRFRHSLPHVYLSRPSTLRLGFRLYGFATVYLMSITALDLEISTLDLKFTNTDLTRVTRSLDFVVLLILNLNPKP